MRLGLLVIVAMMLAACGRKGPLEMPADAPPVPAGQTASQERILPAEDSPGLIQPPSKTVQTPAKDKLNQAASAPSRPINGPTATTPKRPFLLDPLL